MSKKDFNTVLNEFIDTAHILDKVQIYARFGGPLNIQLDRLEESSLMVMRTQQGSIIASQWVDAMQRTLHLIHLFRSDILSGDRLIPFDEMYAGLDGIKYTLDSFVRYTNRESSRFIERNSSQYIQND